MDKYLEEIKFYNSEYLVSLEYKKDPKDSVYYDLWIKILGMLRDNESIIEIGCGSGQLAKLLLDNSKNYLYGFDYSKVAIGLAKEMNPNDTEKFKIANLYEITKKFKATTVICTEILEHLDNDYHVFRLMKPGTRFIFSVPDFWSKMHKRVYSSPGYIANRYKKFIKISNCQIGLIVKKDIKHIYLVNSIVNSGIGSK